MTQTIKSFTLFLMLTALIASGYFYVQQQTPMALLLVSAFIALTFLLSFKFPSSISTQTSSDSNKTKSKQEQLMSLAIIIGLGLLFLMGQIYMIKAMVASKIDVSQVSYFKGLIYNLAALALAIMFFLRATNKKLLPQLMNYRLFFLLAMVGSFIWLGMLISKSSLDLGPYGRYFCLFDDAMISLKYAWNLTHGLGLVWNPGERVEGYTNLMMVLYMSLGTLFLNKNMAVLFVQLSGAAFLLAIAILHFKIASHIITTDSQERKKFYLVLAFLSPIFYYPLVYWSLLGMETGLLCLLMSATVYMVIADRARPRFNPWLAILLGLITWVRPDAVVQVSLIFAYRLYTIWATKAKFTTILFEGFIFVIFPLGQVGFRYLYYHELYPNTYLLKIIGYHLADRLANGKKFMFLFFNSAWIVTLLSIISVLLNYKKEKLLILFLFLSVSSYQLYVGGDPWPYWRIMAPYIGLLLIANIDLFEKVISWISKKSQASTSSLFQSRGFYQGAVMLCWFLILVGLNGKFLPEIYLKDLPYSVVYNLSNVQTALHLENVCKPEAKVGVTWAGTIPYYSGLRGVDFLGKCDRHIASLPADATGMPGHNKYDLSYSIGKLKPDYVQTYFWLGSDMRTFVETNYTFIGNRWYLKESKNIYWEKMKTPY